MSFCQKIDELLRATEDRISFLSSSWVRGYKIGSRKLVDGPRIDTLPTLTFVITLLSERQKSLEALRDDVHVRSPVFSSV